VADGDELAVPGSDPWPGEGAGAAPSRRDGPGPCTPAGTESRGDDGAEPGTAAVAASNSGDDLGNGPRDRLLAGPGATAGDGGLRWSFEFDLEGVLAAAGRSLEAGGEADQEEILAAELAARDGDGDGAGGVDLAGVVAEGLAAGPGLAAWLSQQVPGGASDRDLAGLAAAFRRVASWAQAGELAMVARVAVRSAERDERIGLAADGRPAQVSRDAAAQVSLGLALSPCGGEAWAQLAVTLQWRLPATGAALAAGDVDLYRAKVIAEATRVLSQEAARAVEGKVLPGAGEMTYGQLHAAVRRAVIAADPQGAEQRREAAERQAAVRLYPDEDHTATLAGYRLPAVQAAAAMARLSAMAAAMKASGAGGGMDFLRAYVFLGSLMGTLPPVPPPAGGPPDSDPPPEGAPGYDPPGDHYPPPGDSPPGSSRPGDAPPPGGSAPRGRRGKPQRPGNAGPPGETGLPGETGPSGDAAVDVIGLADVPCVDPWPEMPELSDADAPEDDGFREPPLPEGCLEGTARFRGDPLEDHHATGEVVPAWPVIPATVPAPPPAPAGTAGTGRPPPGLLDLSLPWATLTCESASPGTLTRIGPVTALQARRLARAAAADHATQWRIILTDEDQHALAVSRLPRIGADAGLGQPGLTGLVGRVTVTMPATAAAPPAAAVSGGILTDLMRAAARARALATQLARADQDAPGGCAHTTASAAYQPPPRIREYVTARDLTCRYPFCGQPAWRGDLDHTTPWDKGGRTCSCNLGGLCRRHHILKQHPGWALTQRRPGIFQWTTPAGCTYAVTPDIQPS
jgi:hypothetical protein